MTFYYTIHFQNLSIYATENLVLINFFHQKKSRCSSGTFILFFYFIAALDMPVMMYFCRMRNRAMMGTMAITAPAMISL